MEQQEHVHSKLRVLKQVGTSYQELEKSIITMNMER